MSHRAAVAVLLPEDEAAPPGLGALREQADLRIVRTLENLRTAVADAEVLFVWDFRRRLLAEAWPQARDLRWVHAASAGVDALLFPDLVDGEVVLTNSRGVFDRGIAEFVLGVILLFAKDLHTTLALQRTRTWRHRESEPVAGRRLLVVGAGSIGREVAALAKAAGMEVTGLARRQRDDPVLGRIAPAAQLHDHLRVADFVAVTAPLTAETRGMFDRDAFAAMRPGSRLVNVGRGEIVDEDALVEALRSGHLAGAALDVFHTEPLPADHPLWEFPNVVVSHHMAGDIAGWREALVELFADNLRRYRHGEELRNVVDKRAAFAAATGGP